MPSAEQVVGFKYGLQAKFDQIEEKDLNTVYFCTDSQRLFVGETEYTRPIRSGAEDPSDYLPPQSLFYNTTSKELKFSSTGEPDQWTVCSNFYEHPKFTSKVVGDQTGTTLTFGGTFKVPKVTINGEGHVSAAEDMTFTLPEAPADAQVSVTGSPLESQNVVKSVTKGDGATEIKVEYDQVPTMSEYNAVKTAAEAAMPKSGGDFTGPVTVQAPSDGNNPATKTYTDSAKDEAISQAKEYADGLLAANDAMVFKGTVGDGESGATVTDFSSLTDYKTGWTYRVITAGTYAGHKCEVGDMIIAVADYSESLKSTDFTVVQTNVDGAVVSSVPLTDENIVVGAGGTAAKDSGVAVSSLATKTELGEKVDKTVTVNGQPLSGDVTISDISGNAGTATSLQSAQTITITGDAEGSTSFDGSSPVTINLTVSSATKATQDGQGNVISDTYATKTELSSSTLKWGTF